MLEEKEEEEEVIMRYITVQDSTHKSSTKFIDKLVFKKFHQYNQLFSVKTRLLVVY
jgi:hypothetical protein